ncbi:preprotein translocase subunit YajC [Cohnella soli]|uniref:Preprotein translocase subunit YajC n=1 Tax=Cohnella soli TaxID=425005 RepID=A0ABW0HPZ5_9BACL
MYDTASEHAAHVDRLKQMNPESIREAKIKSLIDAVRNQELSLQDVAQYTNISMEQMNEWLSSTNMK